MSDARGGPVVHGARSGPGSASPGTPSIVLAARQVRAGYDDAPVLRGIDLDVAAGELVGLLGPSGSGKSTLLYCLAGVLVPTDGTIRFGNLDLASAPEATRTRVRRESFGFVLQFGRLVGDLTAVENVSLPLRLGGVGRRDAERQARSFLDDLGLAHRAEQRAATLSGGEQQRAAVARALIHRPQVVFADEPTGALDSANSDVVMGALTEVARDRGAAVILVTHDEGLAARADRCIRLGDGLVVPGAADG